MEHTEKRDMAKLGLSLGLSGIGLALGVPALEMLPTFAVGLAGAIGPNILSNVVEQRFDAFAERWSEQLLNHDLERTLAEALQRAAQEVRKEVASEYKGFRNWPQSQRKRANEALRRLDYLRDNSQQALQAWLSEPERQKEIVALMEGKGQPFMAALMTRTKADFPDEGAFVAYQIHSRLAECWLPHFWQTLKGDDKAWRAGEQLWRGSLSQALLAMSQGNQQQFEAIKAELVNLTSKSSHDFSRSNTQNSAKTNEVVTTNQNILSLELFRPVLQEVLSCSLTDLHHIVTKIEKDMQALLGISTQTQQTVTRIEHKIDQLSQQQPAKPSFFAPFNAPKPPKQFVQRPTEFNQLINRLLSQGTQRTIAITTALQGGGGFGKTTLAQAICHDERIKDAFSDGILWVTIGQTPSLVELLAVQIKYFVPNEHYTDINAAQARLRALLAEKRVLIVLDDVWQESHARPFILKDHATCAHLITTRQQDIARQLQAQTVTVNQMRTAEATDLLEKWVASTEEAEDQDLQEQLQHLAKELGEWPLLLELAAAELHELLTVEQLSLIEAIGELRQALQEEGFTAFDREDEQDRNRAISISLSISLKRLGKWRERFIEFAIFPEDTDIPHSTIFKLWSQTGKLNTRHARKALRAMRNLSLFSSTGSGHRTHYDADKHTIRLHDVIGAYLAQQVFCLPTLHQHFLSAYDLDDWANLPPNEPYLWHHLAYHLHEAQCHDDLRALLLDFAWMQAKLHATNINVLLADYDKLPDDEFISHIQRTLRQASHILARDKKQLASQLWGRLTQEERSQLIALPQSGTSLQKNSPSSAWLRPLLPSLRSSRALVRTLTGHTSSVTGVAVSPDGCWALSASWDHTVKVWDVNTGQERLSLIGHTSSVTGVAVSMDGRWVLSASDDQTVKVWNLNTGQEYLTFTGHTHYVTGVAVSRDGHWGLSASADHTVKVWDLFTGQEQFTLTGHADIVTGVTVSADGCWALSSSYDKTVKVWDLSTGEEQLTLTGHTSSVTGVAVSVDGRWAFSASWDKTVKVWDLSTGKERLTLTGHTNRVTGVVVSTDGCWVLSTSWDQTIKVWDLNTGQEQLTLTGHTSEVTGVVMSVDGRWGLSASYDKTVKVWQLSRLRQVVEFSQSKYQSKQGQEWLISTGHTDYVTGVAVSTNGRWALSASWDKTMKVWDLISGQERLTLRGHTNYVTGVAVSADGRLALSASYDKTVKVWDLKTGQECLTLTGHIGWVYGVAVSADGRLALSASYDKTVKVWDLKTGQECFTLTGHTDRVTGVAVSADGRWGLSASWDKTMKLWDLKTGQERFSFTGHTSSVTGVAVSADGCWALSASWNGVKVWDLSKLRQTQWKQGQERLIFTGHTDWIEGVAVSNNGHWVLTASRDHTVKVWRLADGQVLATLDAGEALNCCAFAPDGVTILAGGVSGRVHFLRLEGVDEL